LSDWIKFPSAPEKPIAFWCFAIELQYFIDMTGINHHNNIKHRRISNTAWSIICGTKPILCAILSLTFRHEQVLYSLQFGEISKLF
jgi:hypothetical protein